MSVHTAASNLPLHAGIGLRAPHFQQIHIDKPELAWLEVHSENYFVAGGPALASLLALRQRYPISLHSVGLSLGSADALDKTHVCQLKTLTARIEPAAISAHLSWSSIGGRWFNDLLPLPYTQAALTLVCSHVQQLQDALKRTILLENVSSYLRLLPEEMPEWVFIAEVAQRTGCGILLDINNLYVSACNHGFIATEFLAALPCDAVQEIHLAGHEEHDGLLIDTHSQQVAPAVWELYQTALTQIGPVATLIEWDQGIPPLATLLQEARTAEHYLTAQREARHVLPT